MASSRIKSASRSAFTWPIAVPFTLSIQKRRQSGLPIREKKGQTAGCWRYSDCCSRVPVGRARFGTAERLQIFGAALKRANAALFCVGDEIDELLSGAAEVHGRSFGGRITDIQPARVNQFERCFDFIAVLCAEPSAT